MKRKRKISLLLWKIKSPGSKMVKKNIVLNEVSFVFFKINTMVSNKVYWSIMMTEVFKRTSKRLIKIMLSCKVKKLIFGLLQS